MIGLIMFALVVNSTLNDNFARIFLSDEAKGGFDVQLVGNPNNPIADIRAILDEAGVDTAPIEAVGATRAAFFWEAQIEDPAYQGDPDDDQYKGYTVLGADDGFFQANTIGFKYRAAGYESDDAVWQALVDDGHLAVADGQLFSAADPFGPPGASLHLDRKLTQGFEPFTLTLHNPVSGEDTVVTVIGQMEDAASVFFPAIVVRDETLRTAFPDARSQFFYFRLQPGTDSLEYARQVESGLALVSAESLEKILDDGRATSAGFLLLFQGFMGLGLIVGIAALGVIAFRAVVERRQQIGMLRAIGYQRSMVALSFLLESGFVALSGITMGVVLGLSFSWVIFTSGTVGEEAKGAPFIVPWFQVFLVAAIALVASLLMTFFPARAASRVPVAEALRYE
jgi:putative ABC transport system permease protein